MNGKKKIFIALGIVVLLGAVAFANFRFQRTDGITVNTEAIQTRRLEAIVSASGKIQPTKSVNISADTMGRVTDLAIAEGERVTGGSSSCRSTRAISRRPSSGPRRRWLAARSQMEQMRLSLESARVSLQQAEDNLRRQQELWKQGLTTARRSNGPRTT
jgi:HlyD family secretion protein